MNFSTSIFNANKRWFFCSLVTSLFLISLCDAQEKPYSIFDAISKNEVAEVRLETNFEFLSDNRRSEEEIDGVFTFKNIEDEDRTFSAKLSIRGRFRRQFSKAIPPLKINLKKGELRDAGFAEYDDMDLVTYFYEEKDKAHEVLIKEYLAYKLLNAITPLSYRVQLLEIEYIDIDTGDKIKQWAFIIEDSAEMRDRLGVEKVDENMYEIPEDQINKENANLVSVFQYFIGNSDWNLREGKNLRLVRKNNEVYLIPFDFDFCGMVNAPYAVPDNYYNIKSVRDRIFFGYTEDIAELTPTLQKFEEKKKDLLNIIKKSKRINYLERRTTAEYLEEFFTEIEARQKRGIDFNTEL